MAQVFSIIFALYHDIKMFQPIVFYVFLQPTISHKQYNLRAKSLIFTKKEEG